MECKQQNLSHTTLNSALSILRSTTLISALGLTLLSCGGGSSAGALPPPPIEKNPCANNQLQKSGGGCVSASAISADNIPGADGLDLTSNGIPELVFIAPINDPTTGIDFNGDRIIDYYLLTGADGKQSLHTDRAGTSDTVTILTDANNNPEGFDEGNNKTNTQLKDILANTATPVVSTNFSGKNGINDKIYEQAPNIAINCDTTTVCNAISYSINGATPDFTSIGTIILGDTISAQDLLLGKNSNGLSIDGRYELQFIARSASGVLSAVQTEVFIIDSQVCNQPLLPTITLSATSASRSNNLAQEYELTKNLPSSTINSFTLTGAEQNARTIASYEWNQITKGDETPLTFIDPTTKNQVFTIPDRVTTLHFNLNISDINGCTSTINSSATVFVMKDPSAAIFVDGNIGIDVRNNGTRTSPLKSIQAAIQQNTANNSNFDLYIVAKENNTNYFETPLIISNSISLFGGFNSQWNRDVIRTKTKILVKKDITNDPHLRAIDFQNITSDTWLTGFDITALLEPLTVTSESDVFAVHATGELSNTATLTIQRNIINAGDALDGNSIGTGSSYGIYVSTVAITKIELNIISSGKGGIGAKGINGLNGATGAAGENGKQGVCNSLWTETPPIVLGGKGGSSMITSIAGESGGHGGYTIILNSNAENIDGAPGLGICAGLGGKTLSFSVEDAFPVKTRGEIGCPLAVVAPVEHQNIGGSLSSNFATNYFLISNGGNGVKGQNGSFGGSGGGGGGAYINGLDHAFGGSGGGGGEAGFAGDAGQYGNGGGASIAIYLNNTITNLSTNSIISSHAGQAGDAGLGGLGGLGGTGGIGGSNITCTTPNASFTGGVGSNGQDGSPGGNGGDASGGGGGPSIGVYFDTSNSPEITDNTITIGNGGNGGNARHGAAGDGGVSYGLFAGTDSTLPTLNGNKIKFGQPGLGGIINQDTTTNSPGTGAPGLSGNSDIKNF